jgi:hypothetical protein
MCPAYGLPQSGGITDHAVDDERGLGGERGDFLVARDAFVFELRFGFGDGDRDGVAVVDLDDVAEEIVSAGGQRKGEEQEGNEGFQTATRSHACPRCTTNMFNPASSGRFWGNFAWDFPRKERVGFGGLDGLARVRLGRATAHGGRLATESGALD